MDKKLYKIKEGKKVCGVCGGLAEFFGIDPTLVRVGWLILTVCSNAPGLLAYFICAAIMPTKPKNTVDAE